MTLMAENKSASSSDDNTSQPQPGTVISPGAAQVRQPDQPPPVAPTQAPAAPEPKAVAPSQSSPSSDTAVANLPNQEFDEDDGSITWTASEFVAHDKSVGWYVALAICTLILAALAFLSTRDKTSVGVIVIAGFLLGVYAARSPRQLEYRLDRQGISVGNKHRPYDEFRSFSLAREGAFSSIVLMPLKRFAVPLTLYYAPTDEEQIVAILVDQIPFEEHRLDAVDSLMRRIRF
jgi:hypothetical protein